MRQIFRSVDVYWLVRSQYTREFLSSSADCACEYNFGILNQSWNHSREFSWFSRRQGVDALQHRGILTVVLIFFFNLDMVGLGLGVTDLQVLWSEFSYLGLIWKGNQVGSQIDSCEGVICSYCIVEYGGDCFSCDGLIDVVGRWSGFWNRLLWAGGHIVLLWGWNWLWSQVRSLCLLYPERISSAFDRFISGSQVLLLGSYPLHLIRYCICFPLFLWAKIASIYFVFIFSIDKIWWRICMIGSVFIGFLIRW